MRNTESELTLLSRIMEADGGSTPLTQRELASVAGLSLGMTNILLRRLAERGWVKFTKLSSRSIRYALTPAGVAEIAGRTAGYFKRAMKNADLHRDRLETFVLDQKRRGTGTLVLLGPSELDFLLEYLCERHELVFIKSADPEKAEAMGRRPGVTLLIAEREFESMPAYVSEAAKLADIIVNRVV
jgi:DNA-binding MarR family transcriptional regulator